MAQNRIERLQVETLTGQYFFRDLYNQSVYFEDFDDKSMDYLRLDYDSSFNLHGGKNLIAIRGNSDTMANNSEILIEAVNSQGNLIKTQIYDLNDDAHNKVISIDITPETPPGDVILTIMGEATEAPDGTPIPGNWAGMVNFRWTRIFTCKPTSPNKSPITYNIFSKPAVEIKEIKKPFYELHYNQELSSSIGPFTNATSSYILSTSVNTSAKVSYRKSGGKYYVTAQQPGTNLLDFGGFTQDMEDGLIIVREPLNPRPASINGYQAAPVYAETEQGDGFFENGSFMQGAYLSTIKEVISPFEVRVSTPHTTWQGLTANQYQEFEHFQFATSSFELIWAEMPISYSAAPTGSSGQDLNTSYAHVTFNNLEPLTGDVTRVKCYMKNHQAPFDWVLASDNAIEPQELLFRRDHQKERMPVGDFSQWGVGYNGITSIQTYWTTSGVGTEPPSMSLYTQQFVGESPPAQDNLMIGDDTQVQSLDGTAYWLLKSLESASFYQDQWYELTFKALSIKTQLPSWATTTPILEPKISMYMSGSAFTDGGDDLGKFIGLIEDTAARKKHIEYDLRDDEKEVGYKFVFKADGTEFGAPHWKIDSGLWHIWDVSIKPWDRKGYTPGTWDVIFPTIKCNVATYDSLDFKFEFYNDYGDIANYTAVINNVPWENELTATFTNVVANTVSGSSGSFGNLQVNNLTASIFTGPTVFTNGPWSFTGSIYTTGPNNFGGTSSFSGPVTMSGGLSSSGPNILGGPVTMSGPVQLGSNCLDSLDLYGTTSVHCLTTMNTNLVTYDTSTKRLHYSTASTNTIGGGTGGADNLGNHYASASLKMENHWAIFWKDYGIKFYDDNDISTGHYSYMDYAQTNTPGTFLIGKGRTGDYGGSTNAADQWFMMHSDAPGPSDPVSGDSSLVVPGGGFSFWTANTWRMHISRSGAWRYQALANNSSPNGTQFNVLTYNTSTDEIQYTTASNIAGGGGAADNLGNHIATQTLAMNSNWITSSEGYGINMHGSDNVNETFSVYRDSTTKRGVISNTDDGTTITWSYNSIQLGDCKAGGVDQGLTFWHKSTKFMQISDSLSLGNVGNKGGWFYHGLYVQKAGYHLSYEPSTGEITYDADYGGTGGGGCSMGGVADNDLSSNYGACDESRPTCFEWLTGPTTIGALEAHMHNVDGMLAHNNSGYSPRSWLQVDNTVGDYTQERGAPEMGVGWVAAFNASGIPGNFDQCMSDKTYHYNAGHGVRIMTSAVPMQGPWAPWFSTAEPWYGLRDSSGIPGNSGPMQTNAYYQAFYHGDETVDINGDLVWVNSFTGGHVKDPNAYFSTTMWTTPSDKRRKTKIKNTERGLDKLLKVKVRDFKWKLPPFDDEEKHAEDYSTGFIAQELLEILPDFVSMGPAGDSTNTEDIKDDVLSSPLTVINDRFIPLLVQSIQDQNKIIESLTKRIEQLENK